MDKIRKTIEYGLFLLVFLLPLQSRFIIRPGEINFGYNEYLTISLYGTDILIVVLLFLLGIYKYKEVCSSASIESVQEKKIGGISIFTRKIWLMIAGLDIALFISIFFATDKTLALYTYARFLLGVGILAVLLNASYKMQKLILSFVSGAVISASIGIWQFLSQASFSSKWLGIALHESWIGGVSVVETGSGRWLRAYGTLDHPNMLGGFLAISVILLFTYLQISKAAPKANNKNISNSIAPTVMLIVVFFGLLYTFSRGSWLSLFIALVVLFVWIWVKRDQKELKKYFKNIFILTAVFLIFFSLYNELLLSRLTASTRLEKISVSERLEYNHLAWKIISDNPLSGIGLGNYALAASKYDPGKPSFAYQPAHNVFLLVWAESGLFALLFLCGLFFGLLYQAKEFFTDRPVAGLILSVYILLALLFDHWWWSLHFGSLLFWFLIAMIIKVNDQSG